MMGRAAILGGVVREGFSEEVTLERRLKGIERVSCMKIWRTSLRVKPGSGEKLGTFKQI